MYSRIELCRQHRRPVAVVHHIDPARRRRVTQGVEGYQLEGVQTIGLQRHEQLETTVDVRGPHLCRPGTSRNSHRSAGLGDTLERDVCGAQPSRWRTGKLRCGRGSCIDSVEAQDRGIGQAVAGTILELCRQV